MDRDDYTQEELCEFIAEAKINTFATEKPKKDPEEPRMKKYSYKKGDFRYEDRYFGNSTDIGQETVFFKEEPIWGMVYRGGLKEPEDVMAKEIFAFLKETLKKTKKKVFRQEDLTNS